MDVREQMLKWKVRFVTHQEDPAIKFKMDGGQVANSRMRHRPKSAT